MFLLAEIVMASSGLLGLVILVLDITAIATVAGRVPFGHDLPWESQLAELKVTTKRN